MIVVPRPGVPSNSNVPSLAGSAHITSLFIDRDESLWMATTNEGIYSPAIASIISAANTASRATRLGLVNGDLPHYRTGKLEVFPLLQDGLPMAGLMIDADGSGWPPSDRNGSGARCTIGHARLGRIIVRDRVVS